MATAVSPAASATANANTIKTTPQMSWSRLQLRPDTLQPVWVIQYPTANSTPHASGAPSTANHISGETADFGGASFIATGRSA